MGQRFQRGSGCFPCGDCGKLTRDTGGDNGGVGLCPRCYERAGLVNEHSDDGHPEPVTNCPTCEAIAARREAAAEARAEDERERRRDSEERRHDAAREWGATR